MKEPDTTRLEQLLDEATAAVKRGDGKRALELTRQAKDEAYSLLGKGAEEIVKDMEKKQ